MFWDSVQGCSLKIGNSVLSAASVVECVPTPAYAIVGSSLVPVDYNMSIILSDGAVVLNTDLPSNGSTAYQNYVQHKRDAIDSGGSGALNTATGFDFEAGYNGAGGITDQCLMKLNGLQGPIINFVPSLGVTITTRQTDNGLKTTISRSAKCDTKSRYEELYKLQMIIYHALNKIAWRLLRDSSEPYVEGSWQQYQGIMAAWSLIAVRAQYVYSVGTLNESIGITLGWLNPSCEIQSFLVYADVEMQLPANGAYNQLIIYPAGSLSNTKTTASVSKHPQDANSVVIENADGSINGTIFFVARMPDPGKTGEVYSNTVNRTVLNTALTGFGTLPDTQYSIILVDECTKKNNSNGCPSGAWHCIITPNGTVVSVDWKPGHGPNDQECTSSEILTPSTTDELIIPESYEDITDVRELSPEYTSWKFRIGILRYGVGPGDGYAKQFYMGLRPVLQTAVSCFDDENKTRNKYQVNVTWIIKNNTSTIPPDKRELTIIRKNLGNFDTIPVYNAE